MENDGRYWYPFQPWLRWPLRLAGMCLILRMATEGFSTQKWPWQALLFASAYLIWSFQTPRQRPKTLFTQFVRAGSFVIGIFTLCVVLSVAYLFVVR